MIRARRLSWIALLAAAWACASPPTAPEERHATPLSWRATHADAAGELYLLGSIHVGAEDARPLHPRILDAFAGSEALVVEIDLSATPPERIADALRARAVPPEGRTLPDLISPETWRALRDWLAEQEIPESAVMEREPWAVYLMVVQQALAQRGYQPERGVDRRFIDAADGRMPIVALETAELQFDVFDGFSWALQEELLRGALAEEGEEGDPEALFRAWERGDEGTLARYFFDAGAEDPAWKAIHEALFFERNERMARRLDALARDGVTRFVVLGAGHMVGPQGVPVLLAARGWRVERLTGAGLR